MALKGQLAGYVSQWMLSFSDHKDCSATFFCNLLIKASFFKRTCGTGRRKLLLVPDCLSVMPVQEEGCEVNVHSEITSLISVTLLKFVLEDNVAFIDYRGFLYTFLFRIATQMEQLIVL